MVHDHGGEGLKGYLSESSLPQALALATSGSSEIYIINTQQNLEFNDFIVGRHDTTDVMNLPTMKKDISACAGCLFRQTVECKNTMFSY
jgi:hypothetical protein